MMTAYFYHHYENGDALVMEVFSKTLPECLKDTRVTRVDLQIYKILKCIHCPPFYNCSKEILSQWALIPSESELFAKQKENCLLPFVYLKEEIEQEEDKSQDGTNAEALDGDSSSTRSEPTDQEIDEILRNLHMPALDISVFTHLQDQSSEKEKDKKVLVTNTGLVKALECPNISKPSEILQNLSFYYQSLQHQTDSQRFMLTLSNDADILLQYLGQINFKDSDAKQTIRGLPVFLTINGSLSSLSEQVYVWPDDVPKCGIERLDQEDVTFLDSKGSWRNLGDKEALRIQEIQPVQLYLDYIFPQLSSMSDNERREHLKHIKDNILDVCLATNPDKEFLEAKFVHHLSNLPIIRDHNNKLCCVSDFADHRQKIFNVFKKRFQLLPDHSVFRTEKREEWMKFLCKIGLVSKVNKSAFVSLCRAVEERDYSVFHDLHKASETLLHYLLHSLTLDSDKCPWIDACAVLRDVSEVKFVIVKKLPHLNQIAPQYTDNCIAVESMYTHLCALRGAAVAECANVLWTVQPIIEIENIFSQDHAIMLKLENCGLTTNINKIAGAVIVQNLKKVTTASDYADLSLFENYDLQPSNCLLVVIIKHFEVLSKKKLRNVDPKCFHNMKCIPVCAGKEESDQLVLVEPITVVMDSEADELKPFCHSLHKGIEFSIPAPFLKLIGVQDSINPKLCSLVLQKMRGQTLVPETTIKVLIVLNHLYKQLKFNPNVCDIEELYLPNLSNELVLSKTLFYCDDQRLSRGAFQTESIFKVHENHSADFEYQLCCLLPKTIRPQALSLSCEWSLTQNCRVSADDTGFTETLHISVKHRFFLRIVHALLDKFNVTENFSSAIRQYIQCNIFGGSIKPVDNLEVSLHQHQRLICIASVKFYIDDCKSRIYIDSNVQSFDGDFSVLLPMSTVIVRAALPAGEMLTSELQSFATALQLLMKACTDEQFKLILQHYQLDLTINKIEKDIPQPDPEEGKRWLRQSQVDLKACKALYSEMIQGNSDLAGHVCFLAHQVAEKALKGGMYAVFGYADLMSHHLYPMASALSSNCVSIAIQLQRHYIPTRYPNTCSKPKIPADHYDASDAHKALSDAERVLQCVASLIHAQ